MPNTYSLLVEWFQAWERSGRFFDWQPLKPETCGSPLSSSTLTSMSIREPCRPSNTARCS